MHPADWLIIIIVLVVSILDVVFVVLKTPTVSRRMKVIGNRLSLAAYVWGALGGHFWGVVEEPLLAPWYVALGVLIGVGVALAGVHWLWWRFLDAPDWLPFGHLIIGCGMGAVLIPV